jgi:hypothetical protein
MDWKNQKQLRESTRNDSLLDPKLFSNLDIVIDSDVISVNRDISHHDGTLINIKIPCLLKRSYMRNVWLYKNADLNKQNQELLELKWGQFLFECTNADEMYNRLTPKYLE